MTRFEAPDPVDRSARLRDFGGEAAGPLERRGDDRVLPPAQDLADRSRRLLERYPLAEPFLAEWPASAVTRDAVASRLPVLRYLDRLLAGTAPATEDLTDAVVARADALCWRQTYTARDFGASFLQSYGWTELIGLRGPIASARIACGFLLLGPMTHYPRHAHAAEEIYLLLSGTAAWHAGEEREAPQLRAPGDTVHHPPRMPHAMRTFAQPLFALYVWRGGDLAATSQILRHA